MLRPALLFPLQPGRQPSRYPARQAGGLDHAATSARAGIRRQRQPGQLAIGGDRVEIAWLDCARRVQMIRFSEINRLHEVVEP
jgi:hypothetical protein